MVMTQSCYSEGQLVIGKLGTNPWWPGVVTKSKKTNSCYIEFQNNRQIHVKFFEINTETWLESTYILNFTTRNEMESYLVQTRGSSSNCKYLNNVPDAMTDLYNKAWKLYYSMQKTFNYSEPAKNEILATNKNQSILEFNKKDFSQPCEICLKTKIEFNSLDLNKRLLSSNIDDRKAYFSSIMIDNYDDKDIKCANFCAWRYHAKCAKNENDLICSCNKSVWLCSICDEVITVAQLFVCDKHECMRSYHRSCLMWHFEMAPDTKQCPLHHCINCSLDYLTPLDETEHKSLISCVKCKTSFHESQECLPASYMPITNRLIICYRHLVDMDKLQSNVSGFCFSCGSTINQNPISCKFCQVTYHDKAPCLPSSIYLIDSHTFICHGCKFPYVRRASNIQLVLPSSAGISYSVLDWKLSAAVLESSDPTELVIQDDSGKRFSIDVTRTLSINLQTLDHLISFGLLRTLDMQKAMHHLSTVVSRVMNELKMRQNYYGNAFVLYFAYLFPVMENVYQFPVQIQSEDGAMCSCTDSCTTDKCVNVASSMECTETTCSNISKCRNRRLQKRQFSRLRIVINETKDPWVAMEEAVVKDVLVMEFVGQVKPVSWAQEEINKPSRFGIISLSNDYVIDCNQFCSTARFIHQSERPNLQPKCLMVAGLPRIGLFSTRRIVKGEKLTVNAKKLLFHDIGDIPDQSLVKFTPWGLKSPEKSSKKEESSSVIDLCTDDTDETEDMSKECMQIDIVGKEPLCPICLLEISMELSRTRVLIHCTSCFTVLHFCCACQSLNMADKSAFQQERDNRLLNFVCSFCVSLLE